MNQTTLSKTTIQPLGNKVLVETFERTIGNIVVAIGKDPKQTSVTLGRIIACGEDVKTLQPGDVIYLEPNAYQTVMDSTGKTFIIVSDYHISAKEV